MIAMRKALAELEQHTLTVSIVLSAIGALILVFLARYIDFHPDESIYYEAIPVSLRKDAGLFYNLYYSAFIDHIGGVTGARIASAFLGGGTLFFILLSVRKLGASIFWLGLISLVFILSYQAIFVFDRVRPEAAWWFLSSAMVYGLISIEKNVRWQSITFVVVIALLLPMNHQLSWFSCAFSAGYILMFTRLQVGIWSALLLTGALVSGALLNVAIRAVMISHDLGAAFHTILGSAGGGSLQNLSDYFHLVFVGSSIFLNDTAVYPNLYQVIGLEGSWVSHAFVQALFWLLMFILPFAAQNWRARYAVSFPLFAFLAFYLTGYYNPTYSAGFSLFAILAAIFLAVNGTIAMRKVVIGLCMISMLNGVSFLSTRVLNHGAASFFIVEQALSDLLDELPMVEKVALPERFLSLHIDRDFTVFSNFKNRLPEDLDLLIYDDYDHHMYHFVPDFKKVADEIIERAENMCLYKQFDYPVYLDDKLFPPLTRQEDSYKSNSQPGSWFFRNSVNYTIYVFQRCTQQDK